MSAVFSRPKVIQVKPKEVEQEIVDNSEMVYNMEKKRKKRMGALSQILNKETLGEWYKIYY